MEPFQTGGDMLIRWLRSVRVRMCVRVCVRVRVRALYQVSVGPL